MTSSCWGFIWMAHHIALYYSRRWGEMRGATMMATRRLRRTTNHWAPVAVFLFHKAIAETRASGNQKPTRRYDFPRKLRLWCFGCYFCNNNIMTPRLLIVSDMNGARKLWFYFFHFSLNQVRLCVRRIILGNKLPFLYWGTDAHIKSKYCRYRAFQ